LPSLLSLHRSEYVIRGTRLHCERCLNPSRARACTTRAFTIEIKKVYDSGRIAPPARCVVSVAAATKNSPTADPDPDRRAHTAPPLISLDGRRASSARSTEPATIPLSHPSLPPCPSLALLRPFPPPPPLPAPSSSSPPSDVERYFYRGAARRGLTLAELTTRALPSMPHPDIPSNPRLARSMEESSLPSAHPTSPDFSSGTTAGHPPRPSFALDPRRNIQRYSIFAPLCA